MTKNSYDPRTRTIAMAPDACLYQRFHELAHKEQHDTGARVFAAWSKLRTLRVIGYFIILWVEIDAYRRARRVMEKLGCWTDEQRSIAHEGLKTYILKREV